VTGFSSLSPRFGSPLSSGLKTPLATPRLGVKRPATVDSPVSPSPSAPGKRVRREEEEKKKPESVVVKAVEEKPRNAKLTSNPKPVATTTTTATATTTPVAKDKKRNDKGDDADVSSAHSNPPFFSAVSSTSFRLFVCLFVCLSHRFQFPKLLVSSTWRKDRSHYHHLPPLTKLEMPGLWSHFPRLPCLLSRPPCLVPRSVL